MSKPNLDPQHLAALLDGRLDAAAREEALSRLAASEDDYRLFADTASVLEALNEAAVLDETEAAYVPVGGPGGPAQAPAGGLIADPRPPSTRRGGWRGARPVGVALLTVLVLIVSVQLLRTSKPALPTGYADRERPWSATLGGEAPNLSDAPRAARLGAYHADLELALGDSAQTVQLARSAAALVGEVSGAGSLEERYHALADAAGGRRRALRAMLDQAEADAVALLDGDFFRLGAWTEGARLAAERRDERYFRSPASRDVLARATAMPLSGEARTALDEVRGALPDDRDPEWIALSPRLRDLLRAIAS